MWDIVGHEWAVDMLRRAIVTQRIAHAYLLTGPTSIGKTHLARQFASALNCTGESRPCGECRACMRTRSGTHPDVTLVEPDGARVKIDQVRDLRRDLALSPVEGRWRVCIVSDFQTATVEAANALLKTLEEPPSRVVLILTAADASLLLPTIVSRCQVIALRAVPANQVKDALVRRYELAPDTAGLLSRLSGGRVGWAVRAATDPGLVEARTQRLADLLVTLGEGRAARIATAERIAKLADLDEVMRLWQTVWRDVLLVGAGLENLIVNLDLAHELRVLAQRFSLIDAERAVRDIESLLVSLQRNVNARLALEVMLLGWRQVEMAVPQAPH